VADLKRLIYERNLSLKEAAKFMLKPVARDQAPSVINWENITEAFLEMRSDRRETSLRDLKTRMRRVFNQVSLELFISWKLSLRCSCFLNFKL
tara:strand:+ start:179 stop:457 length:279 start_codon:yes stop_codon:yes gene_type:complete